MESLEPLYWELHGPVNKGPGRPPEKFKNIELLREMYSNYILTKKEEAFVFDRIVNKYMPFMLSKLKYDNHYDRQEVIQLYNIKVLECLNDYRGYNDKNGKTCLFNSYLFGQIKILIPIYFRTLSKHAHGYHLEYNDEFVYT